MSRASRDKGARGELRKFRLRYPARPMLVNQESKHGSYHARAAMRQEWRQAFHLLALEAKVPALEAIRVTVHHKKAGRGKVPDVAACSPSVKAAIDGLVDAGVIPDDGPKHLHGVTFEAPVRGAHDEIELVIEEASPVELLRDKP